MTRAVLALALTLLGPLGLAQGQRLTLEFWHSHEGNVGEALEALVREYNARQSRVFIKSTYVGSYTDGLSKFVAAQRAGRGYPHLMQAVDYGARLMADSNAVVPLEDLARQDGFDLDRLLPLARMRYTIDGRMYGIPFNTSNPLLFINWDAFQEAGVPFRPSWTLRDLEEAARRLTRKDAQGRTVRYGLSVPIGSFFLEHFTFNSGYYWCNNENGRVGRASGVNVDNEAVVAFLETFARLVREGVAVNTGRNVADFQALFAQGRVAIAAYSTAHLTRVTNQVGGRFRVRTAFYPYLQERNGVTVSGAGLYILKGFSQEETRAAWEFVRY
ncbi:extracellular solute-binding protein, partial [Thermus sp.]|uniref:extracellular solute-binding protein n=1 Tax=Thermus sp. TaxID=275 RepID=UPI00345DEEF2